MLLSAYEAIQLSNCFHFKWLYSVISILFNITFTFTVDWRLKKSNLTFQQSSPIARVYNSVQTAVDRFTAFKVLLHGRSADRLTCYRCCCLHVWQWTSVTIIWFDFDSTAVGMSFDVKWQLNDSQIMQRMPLSPVAWLQNGWHSRKIGFFFLLFLSYRCRIGVLTDRKQWRGQRTANEIGTQTAQRASFPFCNLNLRPYDPNRYTRAPDVLTCTKFVDAQHLSFFASSCGNTYIVHADRHTYTDKRTDGRMGLSLYSRFAPWTSVITVASVSFQITRDKHSLRPCYRGV